LLHDGNPVLTWSVSDVSIEQDPAGNRKPNKDRSREKIDPVVAAVMAVGLAAIEQPDVVYDFSGAGVISA
jgi:phage terminase large subunit-like protein